MTGGSAFLDLIRRVRAGEDMAATELVRRYEPAVRRAVRLQLRDPILRRTLDSVDICQSVLASFFVRAASGQYDLQEPEQLVKLLVVMARNKLASQARKSQVTHREESSLEPGGALAAQMVAPGPTPDQQIASRDLLHAFFGQLSTDERQLVHQRSAGRPWTDIARDLGDSPEALRKRLTRALDRAAQQLGLDEPSLLE
ncbi:MAG: sigma-70 family RNA polymerase sigma factor [Gemmataceae bacterium]|nr:sigma-70 family RNA polymerase sigma factor [Gemmataceae bacterium]